MRYVNLSNVLVYRLVTRKVEERFPDEQSLVDAKLMLPDEKEKMIECKEKMPHEITWIPLMWALKLLSKARRDKKIEIEAPIFGQIQSKFEEMEISNRKILNYGWVNFPLAYTQVAHFSVYLYFLAALLGRQYLLPHHKDDIDIKTFPSLNDTISIAISNSVFKPHSPDLYVPFFTLFELFAYLGWIKVAESLLNPFGDDDEDFQLDYLIDRNISVNLNFVWVLFTSYNLLWTDKKTDFLLLKILFSSPYNKISDINKTYIHISNGQKFELSVLLLFIFSSFNRFPT